MGDLIYIKLQPDNQPDRAAKHDPEQGFARLPAPSAGNVMRALGEGPGSVN